VSDDPTIPRFAELLAPVIGRVPQELVPALLAGLERSAAERYRRWAEAAGDPDERQGLLACAGREDEIATRVAKLFPVDSDGVQLIDAQLPEARQTYLATFDPHPVRHQYRMQASAEREGAAAWRSIAAGQPDPELRKQLEACSELEETSAAWLEDLLSR
jgi:hypothetical protein